MRRLHLRWESHRLSGSHASLCPQSLTTEYRKIVDEQVVESLGESVPELVDAVMEKLTSRASASAIISEVEPVSISNGLA